MKGGSRGGKAEEEAQALLNRLVPPPTQAFCGDRQYRIVRDAHGRAMRYERLESKADERTRVKAEKRARRAGVTPMAGRNVQTVEQVKRELELIGANLVGACGAFRITNEVARRVGFGLLRKAGGHRAVPLPGGACASGDEVIGAGFAGFATDYIIDPATFFGYDILGDGGGANVPQWPDEPETAPDMVARNRQNFASPLDLGSGVPVDPVDPGPTPIPTGDLVTVLAKLTALSEQIAQQERLIKQLSDQVAGIKGGGLTPDELTAMFTALTKILAAVKSSRVGHTAAFGGRMTLDQLP